MEHPANTAFQIVTIRDGQRVVIETVGSMADALTQQAALPFPTRIMPLEVGFDAENAEHLRA